MRLEARLALILVGVVALAGLGALTALLAARSLGETMEEIITSNVSSVRAAEELEISLLEQRGLTSAFLLDDGNEAWLQELETRRAEFEKWLARARAAAREPEEHRILADLGTTYLRYDAVRDRVLETYRRGEKDQARRLQLGSVKELSEATYQLSEALIATNERAMDRSVQAARRKIARTTLLVSGSLGLTILGSLALLLAFVRGVLNPVRRLAREAREARGEEAPSRLAGPEDELREVGRYLRDLVSDVEESREQIERSRVHLESAEKLASVGKLAASVAHEIRNPLTSIRMRLYTLRHQIGSGGSGGGGGSAGGSGGRGGGGGIDGAGGVDLADQAEDFEVIDSELRRLESIVHNFLEFSRPPQLSPRVEPIPPLIEQTLELMEPWLESRRVRVHCDLETDLPRVFADAAQIRQVFVNLIRNAVEAMPEGGELTVTGCAARNPSGSDGVALRFEDTGPGIADEARERIFDPFFTTKAEGTGLGLTIAAWIVARHEGRLDLEGTGPRGSRFSLWLPSAAAHREG